MGRPPSNGGPSFRFSQSEVVEMETILQEHLNQMPTREVLDALAKKFSGSAERVGKLEVQMKQVWNWFQNRRYAVRAKTAKYPEKLGVTPMPRNDSTAVKSVSQIPQSVNSPSAVQSLGRAVSDQTQMEFEAKSARDGAWYDVTMFLSHRSLEMGDMDVLVRFSGFGAEEDEWINVRKHVRQRSLPCESSECVAVLPGDLTLCFQEGKEQALYFDAHVLDAQRRRHDVRGCRCRFLVRYDHDQSEEIVPLRKVCRRPETDYRLQQLHVKNELGPANQQKTGADSSNTLRVYPPMEPRMQKQQQKAEGVSDPVSAVFPPTSLGNVNLSTEATVPQPKTSEIISSGGGGTSVVTPPANVAVTSGAATSIVANVNESTEAKVLQPKTSEIISSGGVGTSVVTPPANVALTSGAATSILGNVNVSTEANAVQPKTSEIISSGGVGTSVVTPPANVAGTSVATSVLGDVNASTEANVLQPPKTSEIISSCGVGTSVVTPPANVAGTSGAATSVLRNVNASTEANVLQPKTSEIISSGGVETPVVTPPSNVAGTSGAAISIVTGDSDQNIPQG